VLSPEISGRYTGVATGREIDSNQRKENTPVSHLEMNLAPTAQDVPDMDIALIRTIIAAADKDRDEMTVLLIHGEPAAVIAPYGYERRPGAAAEIRFDQTAPPEARFMLTDVWGGSIRMSTGEFRQLAREGVLSRMAIGASGRAARTALRMAVRAAPGFRSASGARVAAIPATALSGIEARGSCRSVTRSRNRAGLVAFRGCGAGVRQRPGGDRALGRHPGAEPGQDGSGGQGQAE